MATAPIVYIDNNPNGRSGTLFEGKKFWLSRNVPQRSKFKDLIEVSIGPLEMGPICRETSNVLYRIMVVSSSI
jgi:hypothetical protein